MEAATVLLVGGQTRQAAIRLVERAPSGWTVTVAEPGRTLEQSDKFYAICSELARSEMTWDGKRQTKRAWHDLLIHAWMLATDRHPMLVPGLNGGRVSLLMGTRDMSKTIMSELIDHSIAWAIEHGVALKE
jgi:NinB protein